MITINLLAPGKRRAAGPTPGTVAAIGGVVALVVILAAFSLYLGSRVSSLNGQLTNVNKQLDALHPVAQEVQRLDSLVRNLEDRQTRLKMLLATQLPASSSLEAIKAVIPSDVWLVNVTTQGGGHNVLFDGYTFTYKSVARFMIALRDTDRFRNVDLTSTSKDRVGERDVVKFQITGELVGGPAKAESPTPRDPVSASASSVAGGSR
jgi:Tfp pilus assembly protein PilN